MHPPDDDVEMCGQTQAAQVAQAAMHEAQRLFRRHLSCWASDLIALRAAQLDQPRWAGRQSAPGGHPWSKAA